MVDTAIVTDQPALPLEITACWVCEEPGRPCVADPDGPVCARCKVDLDAERAADAIEPGPCRCWHMSPPLPHNGHCCMRYPTTPETQPGPPPCGHWPESLPRPEGVTP